MTPTVGGNIDSNFFSRYDTTVQAALATGAYVILDLVFIYISFSDIFVASCIFSTITQGGMGKLSDKVDRQTHNTHLFGLKSPQSTNLTTR